MDISQLQREVQEWNEKNFPGQRSYQVLLGAVEEIGELAHAHLKQEQGIRGSLMEHEVAGMDAVGDTIIFLTAYCSQRGWDMQRIIDATWAEVKQRDWTKNKASGAADKDPEPLCDVGMRQALEDPQP